MSRQVRMQRMQFYIEPELRNDLEALAKHRNVSMAELIREAIRGFVIREMPKREMDPILDIIGMIESPDGPTDVGKNHDRYIYRKDWEEK
ncbi:MAG: ribbon-helix-helix protein, CopG family [Firmicutes bacterium]|nr:ribbon-helix-helix protein, CopG family [Bacillota bacterium]